MQLKGLVSFFTVLLIAICAWQLSFTWFVRSHENKMQSRAEKQVSANLATPVAKYPGDLASQKVYKEDTFDVAVKERLSALLDSTKDTKVTWWGTSYKKARESELNLGLDLQGGMNVTMEVELVGLLKSMANNSKDQNFLKSLENANARKANSNADFITLFSEEYKKLAPNGRLASLFASNNQGKIKVDDGNDKVIAEIRSEAKEAINRTYKILSSRIDQFGVAQPNINLEESKGIITVELPGVDDEERVRKYLQASANLQFWEVYKPEELNNSLIAAQTAYDNFIKGIKSEDSTGKVDSTGGKQQTLAEQLGGGATTTTTTAQEGAKTLFDMTGTGGGWIGGPNESGAFGSIAINDTGRFRDVLENPVFRNKLPGDARFVYGMAPRLDNGKTSDRLPIYALKTYGREVAPLEGDVVTDARPDFNPTTNQPIVSMSMNNIGARDWAKLTKKSHDGQIPIAIVLDEIVYSAPVANEEITDGNSQITGRFNVEEATDLANILKAGKLPAPAKIVQEQVVGPTLGEDAILGGRNAFLISFAVIFLLMLVYYNTAGWIANIALILNLLFTIGVLAALGATLTAPGIAGLVLTIGMAVDTNVIIYERIKEELNKGKAYMPAISEGYRRSLPPVLDAHVTTLLTAIILFYFGLGPVKGFATTQILGIILSLFCGILVSRWVSDMFTNRKRHLEYFTGVSRRVFKHAAIKFIEYRKIAYGISVAVLLLGVGAVVNGFDQGVEFSGGRSYQVRFDQSVTSKIEDMRKDLEVSFGENPVIKTLGGNNQVDITTSYLIKDTRPGVDSMVSRKLYDGLKKYLPQDLTFEKFNTTKQYKLGSKTVLPTISDDLKTGAMWATFWSLLVISLYIFIRFRDWRYSLGTIVALLHDVLVILAVFSFLKGVVPFPLEIDQHFIAAVLTVIGFSMNDTVIVFDRIREDSRLMPNAPRAQIINRAINETLSRTVMTSLTVFLVILILFLVGGEVTRGFAFAMLIGIVTGTYSSIFVAAPILVDLGGKRPLGVAEKPKAEVKK